MRTGKRVAVVGSGPAGLATADQLNRAGHLVTVFERADRIGGLLRYGIPAFKLEKRFLDRRLTLLQKEGIVFRTGCDIGGNVSVHELRSQFDALVLAGGADAPRDLKVPGRELAGIHFAMEFLTQQNRLREGDTVSDADLITAKDKHVIIIGGGDTGADCLGTVRGAGLQSGHSCFSRSPFARWRIADWSTTRRIARMCSGVVPQQPPMSDTPSSSSVAAFAAMKSGSSG